MDSAAFEKILKISEEFFGTQSDPDQMPISHESAEKLNSIHPDTVLYMFNEKGDPIAWIVTIPTSIETMNNFIHKKITERELLDIAVREKSFDALYLCAVFVLPEYRRKGYAINLVKKSIFMLSGGGEIPLYCWLYSDEGKKLVSTLEKDFGRSFLYREE